jgi:hypothetical protein
METRALQGILDLIYTFYTSYKVLCANHRTAHLFWLLNLELVRHRLWLGALFHQTSNFGQLFRFCL